MGRQPRLRHQGRRAIVGPAGRAAGVAGGQDRPAGGRERRVDGGGPQADRGAGHCPPVGEVFRRAELVNRFQCVQDHTDVCGVKRLCEVIEIARSSFYAWLAAPARAATTCAPSWSRTPSLLPHASRDHCPARSSTRTTGRSTPRRADSVPGSNHRVPGRVPLGQPLQHPPTPLRDRQDDPERLRNRHIRCPHGRGITETTPCPRSGVKAPSARSTTTAVEPKGREDRQSGFPACTLLRVSRRSQLQHFYKWLFRETVKPQARRVPSGPAEVFTTAPSGGSPQRESGIGRARQPRS